MEEFGWEQVSEIEGRNSEALDGWKWLQMVWEGLGMGDYDYDEEGGGAQGTFYPLTR